MSILKVLTPPPGCGGRNVPTAEKSEQFFEKNLMNKKNKFKTKRKQNC